MKKKIFFLQTGKYRFMKTIHFWIMLAAKYPIYPFIV
jgi:hypothetical protein